MSGCVAWSSVIAAMGRKCDSVNKGCMRTEGSSWPVLLTQAVFLGRPTYSHFSFAARVQRNAYSDEQFIRWLRRGGPPGGGGFVVVGGVGTKLDKPGLNPYVKI